MPPCLQHRVQGVAGVVEEGLCRVAEDSREAVVPVVLMLGAGRPGLRAAGRHGDAGTTGAAVGFQREGAGDQTRDALEEQVRRLGDVAVDHLAVAPALRLDGVGGWGIDGSTLCRKPTRRSDSVQVSDRHEKYIAPQQYAFYEKVACSVALLLRFSTPEYLISLTSEGLSHPVRSGLPCDHRHPWAARVGLPSPVISVSG